MKLLIDKNTIEKHFALSLTRKESEINKYIQQAQQFDLQPLLPEALFQDLVSETPSQNYTFLMQGGVYTHKADKITFAGLGAVIAYFTYARYAYQSHATDTPFGLIQKENQNASAIPLAEKRDLHKKTLQEAALLWNQVKQYIERNPQDFPLWNPSPCTQNTPRKFRTRVI